MFENVHQWSTSITITVKTCVCLFGEVLKNVLYDFKCFKPINLSNPFRKFKFTVRIVY